MQLIATNQTRPTQTLPIQLWSVFLFHSANMSQSEPDDVAFGLCKSVAAIIVSSLFHQA